MVKKDGIEYYSIKETAAKIGRSPMTIRNWYKSQKYFPEDITIPLPPYHRDIRGNQYFWTMQDIYRLIYFRDSIRKGDLAKWNRTRWGVVGEMIQARSIDE